MKFKNIQTEIDASFLYKKLAEHETDATIAHVFSQMSDIEKVTQWLLQKKKISV